MQHNMWHVIPRPFFEQVLAPVLLHTSVDLIVVDRANDRVENVVNERIKCAPVNQITTIAVFGLPGVQARESLAQSIIHTYCGEDRILLVNRRAPYRPWCLAFYHPVSKRTIEVWMYPNHLLERPWEFRGFCADVIIYGYHNTTSNQSGAAADPQGGATMHTEKQPPATERTG